MRIAVGATTVRACALEYHLPCCTHHSAIRAFMPIHTSAHLNELMANAKHQSQQKQHAVHLVVEDLTSDSHA